MGSKLDKLAKLSAVEAAQLLLGAMLERKIGNIELRGKIVETEAYHQDDVASHSYRGKTPRNEVMFGPAGKLYVYFTYGMHYCCNVVVGPDGHGAAVLLRAIEPLSGQDVMARNRHQQRGVNLANGPAKLCQAFAIDKQLNGHDLRYAPLQLELAPSLPKSKIVSTGRIGISQAQDKPWRFYIKDNKFVSRPL